MLREFAESLENKAMPTHAVVPTALRAFIAYCMFSVATGEQISNVSAQEPRMQTQVTAHLEANEHQQSYASIEEWLERSPESLRAKKALARIKDLEDNEPSIREQAQHDIIDSLQKLQNAILPVPEEFMQPLREKYREASKTGNTDLLYLCQRIIQTIEMSERDAPSTIPSHINYPPEEFPQVLSRHLGLTIEGLNDDLSAKLIRSELKKTPGNILSTITKEDFFIEMDQNGGKIGIRRRVSSDPTQQAYDSGSIVVATSLDTKNIYRATDFLRPKNRGPLLAIDSEGASATLNIDLVVRRSTNTSPMFMEKKHSLAVPQPPNFHETVPTSFLPPSGAYITECPCFLKEDSASLPIIHASSPVQIPLLKKGLDQK